MSRFLSTIPSNLGFFNLGQVESYPTGGGGPTAYGPTSYFGSDPLPAEQGDNLNNPINLGDFSAIFKTQTISNSHGGLSRKQSTFYEMNLSLPRSIQFTQEFSATSYENQTNRNNKPAILALRLFSNDSIFLVKIKTKNNRKEPIVVNKINV